MSPDVMLVLIETLWNVKKTMNNWANKYVLVLIETLWNVKSRSASQKHRLMSINRNIVECKEREQKELLEAFEY